MVVLSSMFVARNEDDLLPKGGPKKSSSWFDPSLMYDSTIKYVVFAVICIRPLSIICHYLSFVMMGEIGLNI